MRFLFLKPKQIGDSLILTPTLIAARQAYPEAEIWVAVRRGCEGILAGCPEIDRVLGLAAVEKTDRTLSDTVREIGIFLRLATTRFDYVFELGDGDRSRLFARAARTRRRYSVRPTAPLRAAVRRRFTGVASFDWRSCHRVEKDFRSVAEFLPLPEPIPPLRFARERTRSWLPAERLTDFAVVQIGTRQGFNRWTREGWLAVACHLLTRVENVILTSGGAMHEIAEADDLRAQLGPRALATRGEAGWPQVADLLYRARLYVGPATAAMHLAAACGCPVVALFGPTIEDHWHPWSVPYRIVVPGDLSGLTDVEERYRATKRRLIAETPVAKVLAACDELLATPRATALS